MLAHGVVDPAKTGNATQNTENVSWHVPACVVAALKEVRLCPEHTEPPLQHTGEFWHWKLTPYGLDMMRGLVLACNGGFAYQETFLEPEREAIPQVALMLKLNSAIHAALADPARIIEWATLLDNQPFLVEQQIQIDIDRLQHSIDRLIASIMRDSYTEAGSRLYHHPHLR